MNDEGPEADRDGTDVEPGGDRDDWKTEVVVDDPPSAGDSVRFAKTLSSADVERFAVASGDTNPLHLDDERAESTRFGGRIVHGTLVAGLLSAALARLPGTVVYLSQDLEFRSPVRVGDRVTAEVTVLEALGDDRYRLETTASTGSETAVTGEAVVLLEDAPEA